MRAPPSPALDHPPPDEAHVLSVCKPGTIDCCRYLCMGKGGWTCEKHTTLGRALDLRVAQGRMRATGDNCPGRGAR